MLEIPGSLQVIAEIGVALAGFSGLVVAFRRERGPLNAIEKFRLQVLLTLALGGTFLSFLPELFLFAEVASASVWLYSSLCVVFYSGVFVTWWIAASRKIARIAPEIFNWFAFSRMTVGHATVVVLLLAAIFYPAQLSAAAAYVLALIWYLLHAAQQFTRMLFVQYSDPAS